MASTLLQEACLVTTKQALAKSRGTTQARRKLRLRSGYRLGASLYLQGMSILFRQSVFDGTHLKWQHAWSLVWTVHSTWAIPYRVTQHASFQHLHVCNACLEQPSTGAPTVAYPHHTGCTRTLPLRRDGYPQQLRVLDATLQRALSRPTAPVAAH